MQCTHHIYFFSFYDEMWQKEQDCQRNMKNKDPTKDQKEPGYIIQLLHLEIIMEGHNVNRAILLKMASLSNGNSGDLSKVSWLH